MKKIILIMLVGLVPFVTMSQKRSKKGSDVTSQTNQDVTSDFMVIKAVEIGSVPSNANERASEGEDVALDQLMKNHLKPSRHSFSFAAGSLRDKDVKSLMSASKEFRSMAQAVNAASQYCWQFINATVVMDGNAIIHYYYMKK